MFAQLEKIECSAGKYLSEITITDEVIMYIEIYIIKKGKWKLNILDNTNCHVLFTTEARSLKEAKAVLYEELCDLFRNYYIK